MHLALLQSQSLILIPALAKPMSSEHGFPILACLHTLLQDTEQNTEHSFHMTTAYMSQPCLTCCSVMIAGQRADRVPGSAFLEAEVLPQAC